MNPIWILIISIATGIVGFYAGIALTDAKKDGKWDTAKTSRAILLAILSALLTGWLGSLFQGNSTTRATNNTNDTNQTQQQPRPLDNSDDSVDSLKEKKNVGETYQPPAPPACPAGEPTITLDTKQYIDNPADVKLNLPPDPIYTLHGTITNNSSAAIDIKAIGFYVGNVDTNVPPTFYNGLTGMTITPNSTILAPGASLTYDYKQLVLREDLAGKPDWLALTPTLKFPNYATDNPYGHWEWADPNVPDACRPHS